MKQNTTQRMTRQELYDLVWSEPMTSIASRYGISDVAFKKKCAKAIIPTPDRGYWAKKDAGKPTIQMPLPKRGPGQDDQIVVSGGDQYWYGGRSEAELLGPLPDPPQFSEPIEELRDRVAKRIGKVTVPREVSIWAAPIEKLLADDDKRRDKQRNSPYPSTWDKPIFEAPFERRRLRILNAMATGITKMGGRLYIHGKEGRNVGFAVGDQGVSLSLDVPTNRGRENDSVVWSPRPEDAQMVLSIGTGGNSPAARRTWVGDAAGKLESKLTEIAIEIAITAEIQYREGSVRNYEYRVTRKAQLEEEARKQKLEADRAERERRERIEKARVDRLLEDATALRKACDIRNYVEMMRHVKSTGDSVSTVVLDKWCTWALAQADRIDPTCGDAFLASMDDKLGGE